MDAIYYVIIAMLALLSVSGLVVGVSNDACNFLNAAIGCKAAKRHVLLCFAAVGVVLGASFSSGMMEVARSQMFNPALFTFKEMLILYLAVMVSNIVLMDTFYMLRLPTSTTVVLVFALLGSSLGMAVYDSGFSQLPVGDYMRTSKAFATICAIFASVAAAFVLGTTVMWLARLLFSFRYQRMYRLIGPLWCGLAFTAITYFVLFKGLAGSPMVQHSSLFAALKAQLPLFMAGAFVCWVIVAGLLQYGLRL
ncbi:MAG: inorganic phosphate transporter, partial [Akkermansia sp.]